MMRIRYTASDDCRTRLRLAENGIVEKKQNRRTTAEGFTIFQSHLTLKKYLRGKLPRFFRQPLGNLPRLLLGDGLTSQIFHHTQPTGMFFPTGLGVFLGIS